VVFVLVPGYRDDITGAYLEPAGLDEDQWATLTRSSNQLGRILAEEYGVTLQVHHHADAHVESQEEVERYLEGTEPRYVSLCLDTGHLAYGGGDAASLIQKFPDRVGYIHIKQMDPEIVARAKKDDLPFGQAVAQGASCEPPSGEPDLPSVVAALRELGQDRFVIVEQDMYPCPFDQPKPIAKRTYDYLRGIGVGGD
jgi:inosose dehydratase